jgi:hypothetical protein
MSKKKTWYAVWDREDDCWEPAWAETTGLDLYVKVFSSERKAARSVKRLRELDSVADNPKRFQVRRFP